ncbi:MAG: CRISPR system precrRNA processing endoribonuclease RAMP protein Cas6 [Firmicutes bacterium]|nr:CRISPR system precrRNA processing endoribonuclease RAMP protein Cas6 [Bacillota bacterium]MDH7494636.1 CRISPR system precrRNA processing endoribonuclease RAMP protein Cas6 [Bacillota bacterium]
MRGIEKLRIARYEFILEAVDNLFLPPYKGSTFRGGFGTAFRNIACSTRRTDCRDCMLKHACPYAYVFETAPPDGSEALTKFEHVPHPFVLEPPLTERREFAPGDELPVGLVLIGRGIEFLPYFIVAFQEFGRMGIGRGRGRFRLKSVYASVGAFREQGESRGDERRAQPAGAEQFSRGPYRGHLGGAEGIAGGMAAPPACASQEPESSLLQYDTVDRSPVTTTSITPPGREGLSKGRGVAGSSLPSSPAASTAVPTYGTASTPASSPYPAPAPGARDGDSRAARALVFDGKENKVHMHDAVVTWDDILESAARILACVCPADGQDPEGGRPSAARGSAALSSSACAASCDSPGPSACSAALDSGSALAFSQITGRVGRAGCPLVPRVTVAFRTMTRLKFQGGLEDRPEFHVLARSLLRRVSSLLYFHHGTRLDMDFRGFISEAERVRLAALNTRWVDWERYSSRQDTRMKLGGLVGTATYEFNDARLAAFFLPWLVLGECVHVGKGCTFGLGRFTVALDSR